MTRALEFWGSQGRVGLANSGPWQGRYVFVYPDTLPEWWTVVVDPSPTPGIPGDMHFEGDDIVDWIETEWAIDWIPYGSEDEQALEKLHFGWRPLSGPVRWLK